MQNLIYQYHEDNNYFRIMFIFVCVCITYIMNTINTFTSDYILYSYLAKKVHFCSLRKNGEGTYFCILIFFTLTMLTLCSIILFNDASQQMAIKNLLGMSINKGSHTQGNMKCIFLFSQTAPFDCLFYAVIYRFFLWK